MASRNTVESSMVTHINGQQQHSRRQQHPVMKTAELGNYFDNEFTLKIMLHYCHFFKLQKILGGGASSLATTAGHWKWPNPPDLGISRLHWASGELTPHYLRSPNTWDDVNSLVSSLSFLRSNGRSGLL